MDEIIHELEPIYKTIETFTKGGPQCGKTVERLYETLTRAYRDLYLEVDLANDRAAGWCRATNELERENARLKAEIAELKKRLRI